MTFAQCSELWLVEAIRDGRVVGAERASFERHLAGCRICAEYSLNAQAVRARLQELPTGVPDAFTVRRQRRALLQALDASLLATPRKQEARAGWLAAALVLGGACLVGAWLFRRAPVESRWVEVSATPGAIWSETRTNTLDHVTLRNGRFGLSIRRPGPNTRVLLTLPDGEIEDLGTVLEVWTEGDHTRRVAVQRGEVILRLRGRADLRLRAGEHWDEPRPTEVAPAAQPEAQADRDEPRGNRSGVPALAPARPAHAGVEPAAPKPNSRGSQAPKQPAATDASAAANSSAATDAEDAAYLRVLDLLEMERRDEARTAVREYLARYPHGFRRLEALGVQQRLDRSP